MREGQKVMRCPDTLCERENGKNSPRRSMRGRVVYIHPKGRFHVVEFELPGGTIREAFHGTTD